MKHYVFYLLFLLLIAVDLSAQPGFCGAIPSTQASSSNLNEIYLDRFGNTYDINPVSNNNSLPNGGGGGGLDCLITNDPFVTLNIGYFELRIYDSTPSDYLTVINEVATYFSTIISQNNLCQNSSPDPVIIQVFSCDLENPSVVAAGSPFYILENNFAACPNIEFSKLVSVMESTIQTGQNLFEGPSGCIVFNSETSANIYTGTDVLPSGMTDLTNVFMHEFMHSLGFASFMANGIFLSTFDLQMGLVQEYDDTGNQTINPLFPPLSCNGSTSCIESILNPTELEDLVNDNCSTGNQTIVLGTGIAPISGGLTTELADFLNSMSHISNNCDNAGNNQFVMSPGADDIRVISNNELEVLQSLGYNVNGQQDCYLIGNNELNYDDYENSCCPNLFQDFTVCFGESIIIDLNDLICNDFTNDPNGLEIIGTPVFSNNLVNGIISRNNNLLTVEINEILVNNNGSSSSRIVINYNISACACETLTKSFNINLIFCNDCSNINECENLSCNEINGYPALSGGGFGLNNIFYRLNGFIDNSPDFITTTDNRTLHRVASSGFRESLSFPINGGIDPGCILEMHYDAYGVLGDQLMNIYGSEFQPCDYLDTSINEGGVLTDCNGYSYTPLISRQIPAPYSSDNISLSNINLPASSGLLVSLLNTSNRPINYITFIPELGQGFIMFDLIDVTQNCAIQNTFDILELECNNFTFTPETNADFGYVWDIYLGNTLIENIILDPLSDGILEEYEFDQNGEYTVQLTVSDECGNTQSSTQTVEVACDNFIGMCPQENKIIIDASQSGMNLLSFYLPSINTSTNPFQALVENYDFVINGDLVIDESVLFKNCNFYFEPNASLIDRSRLFIQNCMLTGCTDLWKGIEVEEGKRFRIYGGSYVSDAQVAVQMGELSDIHISNTEFEKNDVSIKNSGKTIRNGGLRNNIFRGGTMIDGNQASYAFDIVDMTNFEYTTSNDGIVAQYPVSPSYDSEFYGYKTTIVMERSTTTMSGLLVDGISNSSSIHLSEMIGVVNISASTIKSCRVGIGIYESSSMNKLKNIKFEDCSLAGLISSENNGEINVSSCNFKNCNNGFRSNLSVFIPVTDSKLVNCTFREGSNEQIKTTLSENLKIEDCLFYNLSNDSPVFDINSSTEIILDKNKINLPNDYSGSALNVKSGQKISVRDNEIKGGNNSDGRGLSLDGGNQYFICGNEVEDLHDGVNFNNCDVTSVFRQNKMINNLTGLEIVAQGIGEQAHAGNRWIGANSLSRIVDANLFVADESRMPTNYNDYTNNPEIRSDVIDPNNLEFTLFPIDNTDHEVFSKCNILDQFNEDDIEIIDLEDCLPPDCIPDPPPPISCNDLIDMITKIIDDNITQTYVNRNNWALRQMLLQWYNNLYEGFTPPPIAWDCWPIIEDLIESINNEESNATLAELSYLQSKLKSAQSHNSQVSNYVNTLFQNVQGHLDSIQSLSSRTDFNQIKILQNNIEQDLMKIRNLNSFLNSKQENIKDYITNYSLSSDEPFFFVKYYKQILLIEASLLTKDVEELSVGEVAKVQFISGLCPYEIGRPVYMARLLNELIGGPTVESYDDDLICNANTSQSVTSNENSTIEDVEFEVYPNPSSNTVFIKISKYNEPLLLKVYDVTGQLVKQKSLKSITTELDLSDLNSGLLIFEFQDLNKKIVYKQKVVKIN